MPNNVTTKSVRTHSGAALSSFHSIVFSTLNPRDIAELVHGPTRWSGVTSSAPWRLAERQQSTYVYVGVQQPPGRFGRQGIGFTSLKASQLLAMKQCHFSRALSR